MSTDILEIQPQEIRFIFDSKKQCSRSVRLVNKINQHVAFEVITESPRKFCVQPNTGILNPKATCDFTVTMQAQSDIPDDMISKDKFLVRCAMVVAGTTEEDISAMFAEDGNCVEEKSLTVILSLPKFNTMTLVIDSVQKDVYVDSEVIEVKSHIFKKIFDCARISEKPLKYEIDAEEETPLKFLLYFLHQDEFPEDIAKKPSDIYSLLLVADKYCAFSCIKECSKHLRGLKMIEEVALMYLDPWSVLVMNDGANYRMIRSAKEFLVDKYKDIERFPDDVKTILTSLDRFLVEKFNEIPKAPEKFDMYLVEAVFHSDKLQVDSEDQVYDMLMHWSKIHYPHEQQRVKFLMERIDMLVRFKFMSRQKLLEAKDYWKGCSICDKISRGLSYHYTSPKATCKRFVEHKRKKRLKENEDVLELDARKCYEQEVFGILEVDEDVEIVEERTYRRRPIRATFKNDFDYESCSIYMELKREDCLKILADGKCDSQVFYPLKGTQGFILSARRVDQGNGVYTFGLFLERCEEGPERFPFSCRFSIFSKSDILNSDYTLMYENRYTGEPIRCRDLMPWMDLMEANSPHFLGGVMYMRVNIGKVARLSKA